MDPEMKITYNSRAENEMEISAVSEVKPSEKGSELHKEMSISISSVETAMNRPIPIRPAPQRVVVIQGPNQPSNGQIVAISTLTPAKTTNKSLTNPIILPSSKSSIISGKSQIMLQAKNTNLPNILPVTVAASNGQKQIFFSTIVKPVPTTTTKTETTPTPIFTHLPVGLVPAPTNQKIVLKPISAKPKIAPAIRRLSVDNITKSIAPQTNFTNLILPISTAPTSLLKPRPAGSMINMKVSNSNNLTPTSPPEGSIRVVRESSLLASKIPPLQPLTKIITTPAATVTTNSIKKPTPSEKESSPSDEKEYTLSIPEDSSNFMDNNSSFELSIKENSTDVEVTCTISNVKDQDDKFDSDSEKHNNYKEVNVINCDTPPKKIHEVAILKKSRPSYSDNDWKKIRTDFVSILDNEKKVELRPECDSIKIVPLDSKIDKDDNGLDVEKLPEITKTVVTERRRKSHNTILKDNDEIEFTSSLSPEPEEIISSKYKSSSDMTFKKLSIRKELATKSKLAVDDIQIELIKKEAPPMELGSEEDFDPAKILEWNDGIGSLPGSDLKFHMNEFGFMQMVIDGELDNIKQIKNEKMNNNNSHNNNNNKSKPNKKLDNIYHCLSCGCYGYHSEFYNTVFCSYQCSEKSQKDSDSKAKKKDIKDRKYNILPKKRPIDIESFNKAESNSMNGTPAQSDDDNTSNETTATNNPRLTYPWLTGKKGFSWAKYLVHVGAKSAPVKLFKDPFPYTKNGFKVGMKLEGIDPQHASHYCVLTVAEVLGYRMRLHFDGYLDKHDFWVNADSSNIFPAGWCDKNNHKLHPPRGYTIENFNWNTYLKQCRAQSAPRTLFLNKPENSPCPNGFRLGMKLEAVDRKNSALICVATIADIMDNRILVHFDSWDDIYDYWADATSPYIHPVGWCEEKGNNLTPPTFYKDPQKFTWEEYLRETKSQPAPARAFKQRAPNGFKRGMRLECVDKRLARFVRVATVEDVRDHQIRVSFDGWPDKYSYWVDDDCPDIHPVGWCQKSGHPIQPPLTPEDIYSSECETPGCRGWGNALGPHLEMHQTVVACPYSDENYLKDHVTDRLLDDFKTEKPSEAIPLTKEPKRHAADSTTLPSNVKTSRRRGTNFDSDEDWNANDKIKRKKRKRMSPDLTEENSNQITFMSQLKVPDVTLIKSVTQDNFDPTVISDPNTVTPFLWDKHSKNLSCYVPSQDPRTWTEHDVVEFISTIPSCKDHSSVFSKHQIDGEALLMLSQHDLVSILGFKLGPAIKLYNSIVLLRQNVLSCY